jgi:Flp pilus assembly protein TadG
MKKLAHRRDQRGSVAIMSALMMVMLVAFASIVVDVGLMYRVRVELMNAADSAALAAAGKLDGKDTGITAALAEVNLFAQRHLANNSSVTIRTSDVVFGLWHFQDATGCTDGKTAAPCFQALPTTNPAQINAVQVTSWRSQATNDPVRLFFASILGWGQTNIRGDATAIGGGPSASDCAFPMVVSNCVMSTPGPSGFCDYCMQFQTDSTDNAGWTSLNDQQQATQNLLSSLIKQACFDSSGTRPAVDPTTGRCAGICPSNQNGTGVEKEIKVNNGNMLTKNGFCDIIKQVLCRAEADPSNAQKCQQDLAAQPFEVRVPVIDSSTCPETKFLSSTVAGFATMVIYGASCGNGDKFPVYTADVPSCSDFHDPGTWPPKSDKFVIAQLKCGKKDNAPAGGIPSGTIGVHPLLVR